jgi:hypothetical protein
MKLRRGFGKAKRPTLSMLIVVSLVISALMPVAVMAGEDDYVYFYVSGGDNSGIYEGNGGIYGDNGSTYKGNGGICEDNNGISDGKELPPASSESGDDEDYDENGDAIVTYPVNPEFPGAGLFVPAMAGIEAFSTTTVTDAAGLLNAIDTASAGIPSTIILGGSFTVTSPILITNGRNITIDTNNNTLTVNVTGPWTVEYAVRVSSGDPHGASTLTLTGGGTVNVNATGNVHVALDLWGASTVKMAADGTRMYITNTGTGSTFTGHQRRGIRVLQGSTVTIYGDITVDGSGNGTRMGATGIRSRASTVTVNGNVYAYGEYSVGLFVYTNENNNVNVTGSVTATGANSQHTLGMQGASSMGTGANTITIDGQTVTPEPPLGGGNQGGGNQGGNQGSRGRGGRTPSPATQNRIAMPSADGGPRINAHLDGNRQVTIRLSASSTISSLIDSIEGDLITFDLSGAPENVNVVRLNRRAMLRFIEAGLNVEIILPTGAITLTPEDMQSALELTRAITIPFTLEPASRSR